jgi:hypothetical protein
MKASVAITMIICGTVLISLPYIHQTLAMEQVKQTMVALNKTVNLTASLPKYADAACLLGGIVMIIIGSFAGLRSQSNQ